MRGVNRWAILCATSWASRMPKSVSPTSDEMVKRRSRFPSLSPWRTMTNLPLVTRSGVLPLWLLVIAPFSIACTSGTHLELRRAREVKGARKGSDRGRIRRQTGHAQRGRRQGGPGKGVGVVEGGSRFLGLVI